MAVGERLQDKDDEGGPLMEVLEHRADETVGERGHVVLAEDPIADHNRLDAVVPKEQVFVSLEYHFVLSQCSQF